MHIGPLTEIASPAASREAPRPGAVPRNSFKQAFAQALAQSKTRVVQRGDTLSQMVADQLRSFGLEVNRAAIYKGVTRVSQANGLANPDRILIGQRLDLSALRPSEPIQAAKTAPSETRPTPEIAVARQAPQQTAQPVPAPIVSNPPMAVATTPAAAIPMPSVAAPPPATPRLPVVGAKIEIAMEMAPVKAIQPPIEQAAAKIESPWRQLIGAPARLTSEFGRRSDPLGAGRRPHQGIDLASKRGAPIFPLQEGRVVLSGWQSGYGNVVVVRHANGMETLYGHNSENLVHAGQSVTSSTPLATVGSTGRSTAPHLHFEVRRNGVHVDPVPYIVERPSGTIAGAGGA